MKKRDMELDRWYRTVPHGFEGRCVGYHDKRAAVDLEFLLTEGRTVVRCIATQNITREVQPPCCCVGPLHHPDRRCPVPGHGR